MLRNGRFLRFAQSLQFRLVVGFALVLAIAIASVSAYAAVATRSETERYAREVEEARAARVEQLVKDVYESSQSWDQVRYTVGQAARLLGWRVVVQDGEGTILADSHADPVEFVNQGQLLGGFQAGPLRSRMYRRATLFGNEEIGMFMLVEQDAPEYPQFGFFSNGGRVGRPDREFDSKLGDIAVSTQTPAATDVSAVAGVTEADIATQLAPEPRLTELESSFRRSLVLAGAAAGAAGVLFIGMFTRQALAPVRGLTSAARRLGKGDLAYRVPQTRRDEVGELARTFNEMAQGLEEAARQRRAMTADIAHELRTPLTNIKGYLEAIKDGVVPADKETIDVIYDQTVHLSRLVDDLRLLAIADAGRLALELTPAPLADVALSAVAAFQSRANARDINLSVVTGERLSMVRLDRTRMRQVIANLVENALTHTPEGGRVTVTVGGTTEGRVRLEVADTGSGIAAEQVERVFDQFYRVDPSRSRSTGGAGLGLTIVKRLVEAHGGTIRVESRPGAGARFIAEFPEAAAS